MPKGDRYLKSPFLKHQNNEKMNLNARRPDKPHEFEAQKLFDPGA
jgi:hypothetical protein